MASSNNKMHFLYPNLQNDKTLEMLQNSDRLDNLLNKMKKINQFESNPLSNSQTPLFDTQSEYKNNNNRT